MCKAKVQLVAELFLSADFLTLSKVDNLGESSRYSLLHGISSLVGIKTEEFLRVSQVRSADLSGVLAYSSSFRVEVIFFVEVEAPDVRASFDADLAQVDFVDSFLDEAVESLGESVKIHVLQLSEIIALENI